MTQKVGSGIRLLVPVAIPVGGITVDSSHFAMLYDGLSVKKGG